MLSLKVQELLPGCQAGGANEDREVPRMGEGEEGVVLGGGSHPLMHLQLGAAIHLESPT